MQYIDTHTHLFDESFAPDLSEVIQRAKDSGASHLLMPNIDCSTLDALLNVCNHYPGVCFPMVGLHPTSVVAETYQQELNVIEATLMKDDSHFIAIGEVGLDLYWETTYLQEQKAVLKRQLDWAVQYDLPVVLHCRNAFSEMFELLEPYKDGNLRGVFHSFTGTEDELMQVLEYESFKIGINGVVTFKKSTLPFLLLRVPLEKLLLETDAPYLAPTPFRGKRNESAHIIYILNKLAEIYEVTPERVAEITTQSALQLFNRLQ